MDLNRKNILRSQYFKHLWHKQCLHSGLLTLQRVVVYLLSTQEVVNQNIATDRTSQETFESFHIRLNSRGEKTSENKHLWQLSRVSSHLLFLGPFRERNGREVHFRHSVKPSSVSFNWKDCRNKSICQQWSNSEAKLMTHRLFPLIFGGIKWPKVEFTSCNLKLYTHKPYSLNTHGCFLDETPTFSLYSGCFTIRLHMWRKYINQHSVLNVVCLEEFEAAQSKPFPKNRGYNSSSFIPGSPIIRKHNKQGRKDSEVLIDKVAELLKKGKIRWLLLFLGPVEEHPTHVSIFIGYKDPPVISSLGFIFWYGCCRRLPMKWIDRNMWCCGSDAASCLRRRHCLVSRPAHNNIWLVTCQM